MAGNLKAFWDDFKPHLESIWIGLGASIGIFLFPYATVWLGKPDMSADPPLWLIAGPLIFGAFISVYRAWRDQYRARLSLEERIETLSKPILLLKIGQFNFGKIDGDARESIAITLPVSITNVGAQTVCSEFRLEVITQNGVRRVYYPVAFPLDGIVIEGNGSPTIHYSKTDSLLDKTAEDPIDRAAKCVGVLLFQVFDATIEDLSNHEREYVLTCKDAYNSEHKVVDGPKHGVALPKVLPGLKYNYVQKNPNQEG